MQHKNKYSNAKYLIEGEKFDFKLKNTKQYPQKNEIEDEEAFFSKNTDVDIINKKYKKGEMRILIEQSRIDLGSIVQKLDGEKKEYILNPEYQRRRRWDQTRKSRLIESFIINVPIPPIFLYEIHYAVYEVMDGLQRLTTIYDFYKNKFALEGLEYWEELNGMFYKDLPEMIKGGINRRYLSSFILLAETAKDEEQAAFMKQIVFERLNSGGEKLTPQETRNALYNGKFNQLCLKLSAKDNFRRLWHITVEKKEEELLKNKRYREMADVELVLRFFAYRHFDYIGTNIDKLLDKYLQQANNFSDETCQELEQLFCDTIDIIYEIFGEKAFFLPSRKQKSRTPQKTVYDAMMQAFARNRPHFDSFRKNKKQIKSHIYDEDESLYYNNMEKTRTSSLESKSDSRIESEETKIPIFDGRQTDKKFTIARINYFDKFLQKYTS